MESPQITINTTTCWYHNDVAKHMNLAHDTQLPGMEELHHVQVLKKLIAALPSPRLKVLDIGCGTAISSRLFGEHIYAGADLPGIIEDCAKHNYPQYNYLYLDVNGTGDVFAPVKLYDAVLLNALIDVMEHPLQILRRILQTGVPYVLLHRQEISYEQPTSSKLGNGYGGIPTYHSVISENDLDSLLTAHGYEIVQSLQNDFGNWENGGHSFLLKKTRV